MWKRARQRLSVSSRVFGFSLLEEGLMVARGNPLGIRSVEDLAQPMVRFVNREPGAALRVLLDDHLKNAGIGSEAINGYANEVFSHREGAYRITCNVADAALGLRAIAEVFGLGFVPVTAARCDLVIPEDPVRPSHHAHTAGCGCSPIVCARRSTHFPVTTVRSPGN